MILKCIETVKFYLSHKIDQLLNSLFFKNPNHFLALGKNEKGKSNGLKMLILEVKKYKYLRYQKHKTK